MKFVFRAWRSTNIQPRHRKSLLWTVFWFPLLGMSAAHAAEMPLRPPVTPRPASNPSSGFYASADLAPDGRENRLSLKASTDEKSLSDEDNANDDVATTDDNSALQASSNDGGEGQSTVAGGQQDSESVSSVLGNWGLDVSKDNVSTWIGALVAPSGNLERSGPRVWLYGEAGKYKYVDSGTTFHGNFQSGDALIGYGFEGETYSINLLAGVNVINHHVSPIDVDNVVHGTKAGFKLRADAYWTPVTATMTYGEYEYSTAFRTYWISQKVGFDVSGGREIFLGPQVMFFGDLWDRQWRLGGHLSNVEAGKIHMDLSAGYAHDRFAGAGIYGYLETSLNF